MRSEIGVPPGSLVATQSRPRARSQAATRWSWVDFPEPSGPSNVMNISERGTMNDEGEGVNAAGSAVMAAR